MLLKSRTSIRAPLEHSMILSGRCDLFTCLSMRLSSVLFRPLAHLLQLKYTFVVLSECIVNVMRCTFCRLLLIISSRSCLSSVCLAQSSEFIRTIVVHTKIVLKSLVPRAYCISTVILAYLHGSIRM